MNTKKHNSRVLNFFRKSVILSLLLRFSDYLRTKFSESFFGFLLCGSYQHENESVTEFFSRKLRLKQRVSVPFKRFMAKTTEKSLIIRKINLLLKKALDIHLRSLGTCLFSFGLFVSIAYLLKKYAFFLSDTSFFDLYLGIVFALIGGITTSSSKRVSEAICESKILSFLLFSVLGLKKPYVSRSYKPVGRGNIAFLVGIALGALSFILSPYKILFASLFIILGYLILTTPECGVVCIFLTVPFISTINISLLSAFVTLSWLIKLMRGKRTLSMNALDVSVLAFSVVIFLGGVVSVTPSESFKLSLIYLSLMSGYFLTVNLIKTSAWLFRCIKALIFSLSITAFVGVFQYFLEVVPHAWLDNTIFSYIPTRAVSLFEGSNVLAEFLILTIPFLFVFLISSYKGNSRLGLTTLFALSLLCLVFTWSKGGFIAAIVGGMVLLLIYSKKTAAFLISLLFFVPFISAILPSSVFDRLLSTFEGFNSSMNYRIGVWDGVDKMVADCFASGIGLGESAFKKVFPLYSPQAVETAPHTHNLYSQIIVSVGVLGLILFITVLLIFIRHFAFYYSRAKIDNRRIKLSSVAGFSGIVSILVQGFTDYVWYNNRIFLLFWLVLGITSATIRTAENERICREPEGISLDIKIK